MSDYSEKQLLLLSNFVYLPCCLSDKSLSEVLDAYRDEKGDFTAESVSAAGVGGGMSNEDVCTLFGQMDKEIEENPEFGQLSAARKLNDGHVRAVLYSDENDENPVIAYRGTGGSKEAWTDNFEGGYETDTKCQRLAADFITNECSAYESITVTGHSKGGNMSQYVTIMCGESVARCVSFDGQGFNNSFIEDNTERVLTNRDKIKSISAYNDFVNILLTPIAGTVVYVENKSTIKDAHSSLTLLTENEYDGYGNIISGKNQSPATKKLHQVTQGIVKALDTRDELDKAMMSQITGATIASALSVSSKEDAYATLGGLAGGVMACFVKKLADIKTEVLDENSPGITSVYLDFGRMRTAARMLEDEAARIRNVQNAIGEINNQLSMNTASKIYAERKIEKTCDNLDRIISKLTELSVNLGMIIERYETKCQQTGDVFG